MDDYISRQQAINKIKPWLEVKGYGWGELNMLRAVINELENMPSAQPERKTGHWILDRSGAYCCDKCMEPCATYMMMKPRDKFCKMCGAKMEDERKE